MLEFFQKSNDCMHFIIKILCSNIKLLQVLCGEHVKLDELTVLLLLHAYGTYINKQ